MSRNKSFLNLGLALSLIFAVSLVCSVGFAQAEEATAAEEVIFGFEENLGGFEIPDWAMEKDDYMGESMAKSSKYAKEGTSSLEIMVAFPGGRWTASYVEIAQYFDWSAYSSVAVDIYLPETAPSGLKSKMIMTQGEDWAWTEMSRSVKLIPGEWTTIQADLTPGSIDWRKSSSSEDMRPDIRKFGIRVESNMRPIYTGPVYIDNIRLIK